MMAEQTLNVGDIAPDFVLKDHHGEEVKLSELRGKTVVLSWHPLAWTSVCRRQMEDLEAHQADFDDLGTVALGMSVDSVPSKRAWAEEMGIEETRLVSDFYPHGQVAQAYGIFDHQSGASKRSVFIIDEEGVVRWKKVYPGGEVPDIDQILEAVEEI
jgi:peroxiredoxin